MGNNQDQSSSANVLKRISELLETGTIAVLVTVMTGQRHLGAKLLIDQRGDVTGTLGDLRLDQIVAAEGSQFLLGGDETRAVRLDQFAPEFSAASEMMLLFERLQPTLHLVICGAGHVGAALAKLGSFVGYRTTLIDDRSEFLDPGRFPEPNIELVRTQNWRDAVSKAVGSGKGVVVAIVTRGHSEDEMCLRAVVETSPDYVGLIGSKRRTSIVLDRLREAGVRDEILNEIRAPIGLDIGAVTPEEVALAIISEIVAERHQASGGPLSLWRRKSK
jgi:xanthine dehydrogenase accessory factor